MADVSKDPRYINLVEDVRSELAVPMLIKDRCIGVFDLESPELDAFTKEHKELMTLLASQAAVAIENARLYEEVRRNEERIEKELRFAQRVQAALLPTELPTRLPDADVAGRLRRPRAGGDIHDFLAPNTTRSSSRWATCPQGHAGGALWRVCRRNRALADHATALHARAVQRVGSAAGDEHHLHERQPKSITARFDIRSSTSSARRSRCRTQGAVPDTLLGEERTDRASRCALGSFPGVTYDEEDDRASPQRHLRVLHDGISRRRTSRATSSEPVSGDVVRENRLHTRARSLTRFSTAPPHSAASSRRMTIYGRRREDHWIEINSQAPTPNSQGVARLSPRGLPVEAGSTEASGSWELGIGVD